MRIDRVDDLVCYFNKVIHTYDLGENVGTKEGKKKWREVIISKIKPQTTSPNFSKNLTNSLDSGIQNDSKKFWTEPVS
jgi:hypothetical protein